MARNHTHRREGHGVCSYHFQSACAGAFAAPEDDHTPQERRRAGARLGLRPIRIVLLKQGSRPLRFGKSAIPPRHLFTTTALVSPLLPVPKTSGRGAQRPAKDSGAGEHNHRMLCG
jgi:hypothetical protein